MHVCKCEHGCEQRIPIMNGGGILLRHHGKSLISCVSPGSKQGTVGSVVLAPSMPTCLRIPPVILCVGVVPKTWRWHESHEPENAEKKYFRVCHLEASRERWAGLHSSLRPPSRPPPRVRRAASDRRHAPTGSVCLACGPCMQPSVPGWMTSAASVAGMWRRVRMPACMVGKHECDEIRNPWKTNVSGCVT